MEYQEPWAREDEKKTYSPKTTITVNKLRMHGIFCPKKI